VTHVVLTGASGFIGSHVLRHLLATTDWTIGCPVSFRHRGVPARITAALNGLEDQGYRVTITVADVSCPLDRQSVHDLGFRVADFVFNLASSSHVDHSIEHPRSFIENNVGLVLTMLETAREYGDNLRMFVQWSTDEVYGPVTPGYDSREWDAIKPSNPYAASKAMQESAAYSYWRTFNVPLVILNTMNVLGEHMERVKFLPLLIRAALTGDEVLIHGTPSGQPGSRKYIHARNAADALVFLTQRIGDSPIVWGGGKAESMRYGHGVDAPVRLNIVGEEEWSNLTLAGMVGDLVGRPILTRVVDFHSSRPGHDVRYSLDGRRMEALGWKPPIALRESLAKTVQWYLDHRGWLDLDPAPSPTVSA